MLSSTDSDLSHLIATLNSKQVPLKCASTDVIDTAMHYTSIFVAEILLQGESSLLLPMVHTFFDKKVQELVGKHNINIDEINVSVTSRWILSNLTISLAHHLSCACKVKKHGTSLYRTNGDIILALSKVLHKQKNCSTEENPTIATTEELSNDSVLLDKAAECLNKSFQTQVRKYLLEDKVAVYGWKIHNNSLTIDWDSPANVADVDARGTGLLKGCKCKAGCSTKRCSCRNKGRNCSIGCDCINCTNTEMKENDELLDIVVDEYLTEVTRESSDVLDEANDILDWVFGSEELEYEEEIDGDQSNSI